MQAKTKEVLKMQNENLNFDELKAKLGNKSLFASIITETDPRMRKTNNPLNGRVVKRTTSVIQLGNNYQSAIENRTEKLNGEKADYVAEKPKGKTFVKGYENLVLQSDKDPSQKYLRTYYNMANSDPKVEYLVDGKPATDEELETIKSFLPPKAPSKKQESAGLNEEVQIMPRDYKVESVVELKLGDFHFSRD